MILSSRLASFLLFSRIHVSPQGTQRSLPHSSTHSTRYGEQTRVVAFSPREHCIETAAVLALGTHTFTSAKRKKNGTTKFEEKKSRTYTHTQGVSPMYNNNSTEGMKERGRRGDQRSHGEKLEGKCTQYTHRRAL